MLLYFICLTLATSADFAQAKCAITKSSPVPLVSTLDYSNQAQSRTKRDLEPKWHVDSKERIVELALFYDYSMVQFYGATLDSYLRHTISAVSHRFKHPSIGLNISINLVQILKIESSLYINFEDKYRTWERFSQWKNKLASNGTVVQHDIALLLTRNFAINSTVKVQAFSDGVCKSGSNSIVMGDMGHFRMNNIILYLSDLLGIQREDSLSCSHYYKTREGKLELAEWSIYMNTSTYQNPPWFPIWSPCARHFIRAFLSNHGECLLDTRHTNSIQVSHVPFGKVFTADEQCRQNFGNQYTVQTYGGYLNCFEVSCRNNGTLQTKNYYVMWADGTKCSDSNVCYHGECVHKSLIDWSAYPDNLDVKEWSLDKERNIEMVMVYDDSMIDFHGNSVEKYIQDLMISVAHLYEQFGNGLNIHIQLVQIKHLDNSFQWINYTNEDAILRSFCDWKVAQSVKIVPHDIAMLLTRKPLCSNCNISGFAYMNRVCDGQRNCGIGQDGGFRTVGTIAHEVSHLIGMDHEDAKNCKAFYSTKEGKALRKEWLYNFSSLYGKGISKVIDDLPYWAPISWYWSPCVRKLVGNHLKRSGKCLLENRNKFVPLSTGKPFGAIYGADEQCRLKYSTTKRNLRYRAKIGYFEGANPCIEMICKDMEDFTGNDILHWRHPWADGTSCGLTKKLEQKLCYHGECVLSSRVDFSSYIRNSQLHNKNPHSNSYFELFFIAILCVIAGIAALVVIRYRKSVRPGIVIAQAAAWSSNGVNLG